MFPPQSPAVTRILLVDDQPLVRSGLRLILEAEDDLDVVGEAADGAEAVSLTRSETPDVVLMDIQMPGLDGISATRVVVRSSTAPRVVILTTFSDPRLVYDALKAGASGFLLKDMPAEQIVRGVRAVARGDELFAPSITRCLVEQFTTTTTIAPPGYDRLTERESEVLTLMAAGLSNSEIASRLLLAVETVKTHVARVLAKLGLRDRVQVVVFAYEHGIVRPGTPP